jgi:hypothetical protein
MFSFGKKRKEAKRKRDEEWNLERDRELGELRARTVEFPDIEIKCEIWWEGGWYERGSRNNDESHETNIHVALNKSKHTTRSEKDRKATEVGYLVPHPDGTVTLIVFQTTVNKLKAKSAKQIHHLLPGPTPVQVSLAHCYSDDDRKLPDRYDTQITFSKKIRRPRKAN